MCFLESEAVAYQRQAGRRYGRFAAWAGDQPTLEKLNRLCRFVTIDRTHRQDQSQVDVDFSSGAEGYPERIWNQPSFSRTVRGWSV